jgi:hypothetical protein
MNDKISLMEVVAKFGAMLHEQGVPSDEFRKIGTTFIVMSFDECDDVFVEKALKKLLLDIRKARAELAMYDAQRAVGLQ